jgi:hypothetical protein
MERATDFSNTNARIAVQAANQSVYGNIYVYQSAIGIIGSCCLRPVQPGVE